MKLTEIRNPVNGEYIVHIVFTATQTATVRLNPFDAALMREWGRSDSIADKLLCLETLARKIERSAQQGTEARK